MLFGNILLKETIGVGGKLWIGCGDRATPMTLFLAEIRSASETTTALID